MSQSSPSATNCLKSLLPRIMALATFLVLAASPASAQLSPNSGINPNDTYTVFDLTVTGTGTATLSAPLYNPSTNTTSNSLSLTPPALHFHVEVGYDTNDQLVVNIFPTDPVGDPTQFPNGKVSKIQLRNGNVILFDETGAPIPVSLPNNVPLPLPLAGLLGQIPGASLLPQLIISSPSSKAAAMNASLQYGTETTGSWYTVGSYSAAPGTQVQMAYISSSQTSDMNGTQMLAYQQFYGGWALARVLVSNTFPNVQSTVTTQICNLQWLDSPTGNSRRASKAATPPAPPPFSVGNPPAPPLPGPENKIPNITIINVGTGPTNLLYQHGIFSDQYTWDRMDPWLRTDFGWATIGKSNLVSTNSLTNQADTLMTLLQGTGKTNFLAIGHSQGGLIARDAAFRSSNLLLNRVITLDTPNNGAWITQFERAGLASGFILFANIMKAWGGGTPLSGGVFTLGNALIAYVPAMTVLAFETTIPAVADLRPGSSYLTNINARIETFPRAGIESASPWRFVEYRLIGDKLCYPETPCGGRAFVNYAHGVYGGLRVCQILALIFGNWNLFVKCTVTGFLMDVIDIFWYIFTSWGDTSDGMVNGSGQRYNSAPSRPRINSADSHLGATKSDKVRSTLDTSLQFDFSLIPRWCQTGSAWPSGFSLPDIGGGGSFTLTTGNPCPWTAVSSAPWITITSGASGTASGSVIFAAEMNLSPLARTGTITITGLGTTVSVSVSQAGIPAGAGIGSVTISGYGQEGQIENTYWGCVLWYSDGGCAQEGWVTEYQPVWDSGQVWITVNGQTKSVPYGQGSSASTIVSALVAAINSDPGFPVRAGVMGTTVWLVSYATQGANYPLSSGTSYDNAYFTEPSFTTTNSGPTLTGSP